ncbi:hypothetical protein E0500_025095 [Streptomyces sp. KM273126]|uniref:hypothetical protein n=1 Tax=Streptomyces sp. KM273126 TaxID=2545247 RepID=UPI00103FA64F|nr:hypothetical protein [Streptomyces sp. KM273126]MBA2810582.1 hypothetical protein [Streptomyces sp. KM273126]
MAEPAFNGFVGQRTEGTTDRHRAPLLRRPSEVGPTYEDVTFPSMDGLALEGGFIPADSDRLIIHNPFPPATATATPDTCPAGTASAAST